MQECLGVSLCSPPACYTKKKKSIPAIFKLETDTFWSWKLLHLSIWTCPLGYSIYKLRTKTWWRIDALLFYLSLHGVGKKNMIAMIIIDYHLCIGRHIVIWVWTMCLSSHLESSLHWFFHCKPVPVLLFLTYHHSSGTHEQTRNSLGD